MARVLNCDTSNGNRALLTLCLFMLLQLQSFSQNCSVSGGNISTNDVTGTVCTRVGNSHIVTINVNNSVGPNSRTVITNDLFEIVAVSETRSVDIGGLATGTYSIWNVSFESMTGLFVGNDTYNLSGCYSFSNNIDVTVISFNGGNLATQDGGTGISICVSDGVPDFPDLTLTNNAGNGRVWATTDLSDNIIDLDCCRGPDFEGTGAGVVKLYSISACLTIQGISMGMNIKDIPENTDASNAVIITRSTDCCVPVQETVTCTKGKVLMCINNVSTCVDKKKVNQLIQQGATPGGCFSCQDSPSQSTHTIAKPETTIPVKHEVKYFPNPVKGELNISISSLERKRIIIEIVNFSGQTVKTINQILANGMNTLNIKTRDIHSGLYLIRLRHGNNLLGSATILKN